jgi:hypothetical protein
VGIRPREISPVPSPSFTTSRSLYAGEFFGAAFPGSSHLPWPSPRMKSSALPSSPIGANISTLQDSLHVAGCGFALPSQEDTTLQHLQSPGSTGCLLRGPLAVTTTGLPPASRRQLSGHTKPVLGGATGFVLISVIECMYLQEFIDSQALLLLCLVERVQACE